jgi:hypothetical protein
VPKSWTVIQRERSKPIPVRTGCERAVEVAAGRQDRLWTRTERRIGLITKSGLREAGELVGRQFPVENGDVPLRVLRHLRGDVAHLQGRLEIGTRLLVGTEASVKHAQFEAHARERRIVEEQAVVGADGVLDIGIVFAPAAYLTWLARLPGLFKMVWKLGSA